MSNEVAKKPKFSVAITTEKYQQLVNNTLGDPEHAKRFIAAITSSVAVNPDLQQCDAGTILAGALLGESLNLSPSPQLGQYYLIPFECKIKGEDGKILYKTDANGQKIKDEKGRWVPYTEFRAQFCMGYKGYVQLALRSGMLKKFIVMEVKDGELISWNPFNGELICAYNTDPRRDEIKTIGYMARAEYLGGYEAALFWTRKQMIKHADTYVPAFSAEIFSQLENNQIPDNEKWKYSSKWYTNFDVMAKKTMIRQLLSKKALITPRTDLFEAFEKDNHAISFDKNGSFIPLDNTPPLPEPTSLPLPNAAQKVNLDDI